MHYSILAVKKQGVEWSIKCCYHESGCPYRLPSMEQHEEKECKYKPARCPSLTCPVKPAFANLLKHIEVSFNRLIMLVCIKDSHFLQFFVNVAWKLMISYLSRYRKNTMVKRKDAIGFVEMPPII